MKLACRLFSCLLALAARPVPALERIELGPDLELVPLTGPVWRHVSYRQMEGWDRVPANGLVVLASAEAALIDTPWTPEQTACLLDWLEKNRGLKVTLAVGGHSHPDCIGGLAEIRRRNIRSLGLEKTRALALAGGMEAPQETFTQELSLPVGKRKLILFYPGPGHTVDNIVVWIEDEKVLFGGCLVKAGDARNLGNTRESDLQAWPCTLETVRKRFPAIRLVVPGHGEPGGPELLEVTRKLLAGVKTD